MSSDGYANAKNFSASAPLRPSVFSPPAPGIDWSLSMWRPRALGNLRLALDGTWLGSTMSPVDRCEIARAIVAINAVAHSTNNWGKRRVMTISRWRDMDGDFGGRPNAHEGDEIPQNRDD